MLAIDIYELLMPNEAGEKAGAVQAGVVEWYGATPYRIERYNRSRGSTHFIICPQLQTNRQHTRIRQGIQSLARRC